MPTACFLSPHLDDAVFSAGGVMARLKDAGWRVTTVTVFTRSVPPPLRPFALRCQTDKGFGPGVDYMALRRAEDAAAGRALGLDAEEVVWLDHAEAPHRGYDSAADLFAGVHPDDRGMADRLAEDVGRHVASCDVVWTCGGIGGHVDHLHVLSAVRDAARSFGKPLVLWHDTPYVLKLSEIPPFDATCDIAATLARKLDACAAYASQLGFQFGGVEPMRRRLDVPVERFVGRVAGLSGLLTPH